MTADLILTGGHVLTLSGPPARDIAIAGGRVLAVGEDLAGLAGPQTRVVALNGRAVQPGMIDSHTHGLWGACRDLFEVFPGLGAPLQAVLDGVLSGRLLRLGGRERIVLHPPAGVSIIERTVYASNPVPMPPELSAMLGKPAVVLLHSAEAARHFAAECDRLAIVRDGIALGVIGPRVAAAVGAGWAAVDCAEHPDDQALLALASRLCQTARQQGTG